MEYTNDIEDTVYCNSRTIIDPENWPISGNIKFKNYNETTDLSCTNITDQFAVSNNKAKLTYPIAMLTDEERANINTPSLLRDNSSWWTMSPNFSLSSAIKRVSTNGEISYDYPGNGSGVRVVISLSSNNIISSGTGTETDPWIVD